MDRRRFLRATASAAAAASALPAGSLLAAPEAAPSGQAARRPNFILVMADDCSAREFSAYGHPQHRTPNLDALGQSGAIFRTCWATPICSPSRAMILTGRYAYQTGWYHNDMKPGPQDKGYNLAEENITFAKALKDAGYVTTYVGKWQLRGTQTEHGFTEACVHHAIKGEYDGPIEPPEGSLPGRPARYWHPAIVRDGVQVKTTEKDYGDDIYVDYILDFARRHRDEPFVAYYSMSLTHTTWDFDLKRMGYVAPPELDAQGRPTGRKGQPTLQANVEYTDHLIGRLVKGLDEIGVRDHTVVMFTCDNGTAGYGKGNIAEERGPRVPLVVNAPAVVKPIGWSDALVDFADIMPTMLDLAGAPLPEGYALDGRSFAPVLRGESKVAREWIFSNYADKQFLRDARWLRDGQGRFFDCGDRRDEQGYAEVTDSTDPAVVAVRKRFEEILARFPLPPADAGYVKQFDKRQEEKQARRKQSGELRRKAAKEGAAQ